MVLVLGIVSCGKGVKEELTSTDSLISAEELMSRLEHYTVIDFRPKKEFDAGHIPGAINMSREMIENPGYSYKGMIASPAQFEELLSLKGITKRSTLVIYDDIAECDASRLWFVLKYYSHDKVKLLKWRTECLGGKGW